ncbi:MAG: di-trans,poly-cis-decaprenylcistransferase [Ruminococcaceae bacterium]|nr:di-trans,poly-cis-decaprenylcistransferase [Oscillospiraceae bacterium]
MKFLSFLKKKEISGGSNPPLRHIAFIMDGNGRWANARGLPREMGHKAGAEAFRRVVDYCIDLDIRFVTVYAFSTENWKRPQSEVDGIMKLFVDFLNEGLLGDKDKKLRIRFLGDPARFSPEIQSLMSEITEKTKDFTYTLNVAINYGGRDDILHAVNTLIKEGKTEVTEEDISSHLYTLSCPDPDLIVRTGGEWRLSNFLTWQSTYSELYFMKTLWPDMTKKDVDEAISFFVSRQRRFGDIKSK